ncbi:MAG: ROK family transcriptional regulator, partial [Rhodobacteraceae bacterium]|nr:ROK family transcriptional regulator [Paracoccaceae bacterium]
MTDQASKFDVEGTNQSGVRERNERLVLSILRREGPLPKAEIARRTGLSAQTASVIMRALESDGLISKGEKVRGRVGQPSVPMSLAPEGAYFFGLSVGRRSVELILTNFVGQEIEHRRESYAYPLPSAVLDFVQSASDEILQDLEPAQVDRISGMGIAIPFFLWDWAVTIGADPQKMDQWKNFDLRNELSKLFEFPIYLGND